MIPTNPFTLPAIGVVPARRASRGGPGVPGVCAIIVLAVALVVLTGWLLDVAALRSVGPATYAAMNPTVALGFASLAVAIRAMAGERTVRRTQLARTLSLAVATVAALRLAEAWTGIPIGIDTLVMREAMQSTGDGRDNRMAVAAAVNFALVAAALVLLLVRSFRGRDVIAQLLAILALLQAHVALIGHLYRSGWFDTIGQFNRMAVPTAAAFSLVALGVLALRRESGIVAIVLGDGPGAALARGLLPVGVLAPSVVGWIAVSGMRASGRAAQPELVVMLVAVAMIVVFVAVIAWNAMQMHETHLERTRAERALRQSEARFRLLAENGSDVVSLHDATGRILYVSPSAERVLGYAPDEVARMAPFALVVPEDAARLRRHFDDLVRGAPAASLACRMRHKAGRVLWLEMMWRTIVDAEGRVVQVQASSRDVTERKEYERQLEEARRTLQAQHERLLEANASLAALASQDGLTGLKNRRAFEERMTEELLRMRRTAQPVALLLLDIDEFKAFNDSFGHPRGDEVLRQVARQLSRTVRDSDLAVRYGGEEFAVILPGSDLASAGEVAERIRSAIEGGQWSERPITISIGVAVAASVAATLPDLLEHADRALYRSKQDGRNRVTLGVAL